MAITTISAGPSPGLFRREHYLQFDLVRAER